MFGRAQTLKQLALSKTISEDSGLCSRLLKEVFDKKPATSKVTFSMFQIYNENVYDVLHRDDVPLQVLEDSGHQSCVQGLASFEISTVEDAFYLLAKGDSKRYVRETEFNAQSSRSHTIAVLEYTQTSVEGITKVRSAITQESRMILCDLAGSERMTELINPKEKRFVEMKYINLSLTALGKTDFDYRQSYLHNVL